MIPLDGHAHDLRREAAHRDEGACADQLIVRDRHQEEGVAEGRCDIFEIGVGTLVDEAEVLAKPLEDEPAGGVLIRWRERPDGEVFDDPLPRRTVVI